MFDSLASAASRGTSPGTGSPVAGALMVDDLELLLEQLDGLDGAGATEGEQVDYLSKLERLKGAIAASQARVTVSLTRARAAAEAERGIPAERRCRGLANELGLARRTSPFRASRDLGFAQVLVLEMPHTHHLLSRGEISEWRAMIVARETAQLSLEHRMQVDAELADKLMSMGDREAGAAARKIAYRLDPGSAIRRGKTAREDRNVSVRPAPDTMAYLTGFMPVEQAVACYAAVKQAADSARAAGDPRSRGQVMSDTLFERVTGRAAAQGVDVEVKVVMTDSTMLTDDPEPGHVIGYGPIHAGLARSILHHACRVFLRRLYRHPLTGALVAMDSRRREFDGELRDLLVVRDQICRTPWCDGPIRHADHVSRAADDGETSAHNGQGLCEACNYAKEAAGWRAMTVSSRDDPHEVLISTPTGHTYVSNAPDPPGPDPAFAPPPWEETGDMVLIHTESFTPEEWLRQLTA